MRELCNLGVQNLPLTPILLRIILVIYYLYMCLMPKSICPTEGMI